MDLIRMGLQDLSRLECRGEKAFSERFSAKQLSFIGGNKSYINFGAWVGVWGGECMLSTAAGNASVA